MAGAGVGPDWVELAGAAVCRHVMKGMDAREGRCSAAARQIAAWNWIGVTGGGGRRRRGKVRRVAGGDGGRREFIL